MFSQCVFGTGRTFTLRNLVISIWKNLRPCKKRWTKLRLDKMSNLQVKNTMKKRKNRGKILVRMQFLFVNSFLKEFVVFVFQASVLIQPSIGLTSMMVRWLKNKLHFSLIYNVRRTFPWSSSFRIVSTIGEPI